MFNFIMPKINFSIEKWKWNKEYRIYVSNLGHFKDEYKHYLSKKISQGGYCYIKTYLGYKLAHRLVMFTWKPIPDAENLTVDHLNHNKRDNSLNNLEWVTKVENENRARRDYFVPEYEKEINTLKTKINVLEKDISTIKIYDNENIFIASFSSIKDARDWFMGKKRIIKNEKTCNTVLNHIKNAIKAKKEYGNYIWKGEI